MDIRFKATKRRRRKFEPRVRVWKLKEEKTCEEYRSMVGDKVEEAKWKGLSVNDHWQQMKGIMMESAQDICGMTKGPHKDTRKHGGGMRRLQKQLRKHDKVRKVEEKKYERGKDGV